MSGKHQPPDPPLMTSLAEGEQEEFSHTPAKIEEPPDTSAKNKKPLDVPAKDEEPPDSPAKNEGPLDSPAKNEAPLDSPAKNEGPLDIAVKNEESPDTCSGQKNQAGALSKTEQAEPPTPASVAADPNGLAPTQPPTSTGTAGRSAADRPQSTSTPARHQAQDQGPGVPLPEAVAVDEQGNPTERICFSNDPDRMAPFRYCDNYISTAKYTSWSFLPVNLFEQFQRVANVYFLLLLILQLIPQVSALNPATTAFPLVLVLAMTAIKDGVDDYKRHQSDKQVNTRAVEVLRLGSWEEVAWQDVGVGDIVRLEGGDMVPCDLLLLASALPQGLAYVDTAELDGESNLKIRQALRATWHSLTTPEALASFRAVMVCEPPNPELHQFSGKLIDITTGTTEPLDNSCVLLRGMALRNTEWCVGLAFFTGHDTKLMMNTSGTRFKRTKIDLQVNRLIVAIFGILAIISLLSAIMAGIWASDTGQGFEAYLPVDADLNTPVKIGLVSFFTFIILYSNIVPISLYVSVEFIRLGQSFLIDWDLRMYHAPTNTPACARTTTLNEELGQIEYVFSDKTGTLTQNVMRFLQCSINGVVYGRGETEASAGAAVRKGKKQEASEPLQAADFGFNPHHDPAFVFYDQALVDAAVGGNAQVLAFFRLLALCHTVQCEEGSDGQLRYAAESPDEAALVAAAKEFGCVFRARTQSRLTIEVHGAVETYELLHVVEFNSDRKRMSVIVRTAEGAIWLLTKGADSVMFPRLAISGSEADRMDQHLEAFATIGLRTLVLGQRVLGAEEYARWARDYQAARLQMEDRAAKVDGVASLLETQLQLVGVTAIEDRLQPGVPTAIANLRRAHIKVWVLTGDKQETAINIGFSCRLLANDMQIYIVNERSADTVASQLVAVQAQLDLQPDVAKALVIDGTALSFALEEDTQQLLLAVAERCQSVVCCRVSPLQKALVVRMVKDNRGAITLAIGDGANDVSMIQNAHIGVGISGLEGRQAVLASDFSIAQFRYLERLLLVHGRWSYLRMCRFLAYFFYKNFACTLCQLFFAIYSGWSGQTIFDAWFLTFYNVIFTAVPVMAAGMFEQDVNDRTCMLYPTLYRAGQLDFFFNGRIFFMSLLKGLYHAAVCFYIPYGAAGNLALPSGPAAGFQWMGVLISACVVVVVNIQIALDMFRWTVMNHVCIWLSIASWWLFAWFQYAMPGYIVPVGYFGVMSTSQGQVTWWAALVLTATAAIIPIYAYKFFLLYFFPTPIDIVREIAYLSRKARPDTTTAAHLNPMQPSSQGAGLDTKAEEVAMTMRVAGTPPAPPPPIALGQMGRL